MAKDFACAKDGYVLRASHQSYGQVIVEIDLGCSGHAVLLTAKERLDLIEFLNAA